MDRNLFPIKIRLLQACYGTSVLGAVAMILLMRDVIAIDPDRVWSAFLPTVIVMSITGTLQWFANERFFAPIDKCFASLDEAGVQEKNLLNWGWGVVVLVGIALVAVVGLYLHIDPPHFSDFPWFRIASAFLFLVGGGSFALKVAANSKLRREKRSFITPADALQAALRFPLRSAAASFSLWMFALVVIPISFHYYAGYSVRTCLYFGFLIFGIAIIAFPTQYFLFKRYLESLVGRLLEIDPEALSQQRVQVSFRLKFFLTALSLVCFGLVFIAVRNFAGIERVLLDQAVAQKKRLIGEWAERFRRGGDPMGFEQELRAAEISIRNVNDLKSVAGLSFETEEGLLSSLAEKANEFEVLSQPASRGWVESEVLAARAGTYLLLARAAPDIAPLGNLINISIETFLTALFIGLLLTYLFSRDVTRTITVLGDYAQDLARGVLNSPIQATSDDEHGLLTRHLRETSERLEELLLQVRTLADHVAQAAAQLSVHSGELSSGAQTQNEQAETADERMALVSEILSEQREGTQHALSQNAKMREASKSGGRAVMQSAEGMRQIATVVENSHQRMHALNEQATKIGAITETIAEIAAQTNLLALNAAIEASRAGEHGRGFGVVADEIRKLAESSTDAAKEIEKILNLITEESREAMEANERVSTEVQQGLNREQQTESAFHILEESINFSEVLAQRVAEITTEQIAHGEEVRGLVSRVTEIARDQRLASEVIAETATDLSSRAEALRQLLARFRMQQGR